METLEKILKNNVVRVPWSPYFRENFFIFNHRIKT